MKNLLNFFKGKKSIKEEIQPVQSISEQRVVIGVFRVSDNHATRIMEGIYYDYPMMKTFVSSKGALVSSIEVELLQEQNITYTEEMKHAIECIENQWAMRFYQLSDIA